MAMNTFEICPGHFWVTDGKTGYPLWVDEARDFAKTLPDLDYYYDECQKRGATESQTIDFLLRRAHRRRTVKYGYLAALDLVIGFLGPRGSGKSVGATALTIFDYLLCGRPVFSNMPIAVRVKYRDAEKVFQSEELDKAALLDVNEFEANYRDCCVVIDEINVGFAEARRSQAKLNVWFSYVLQQLRHRALDLIYTTQSDGFLEKRLRFQTDLYITCKDAAFKRGHTPNRGDIGRRSDWRIHDMTGIVTGDIWRGGRENVVTSFRELTYWNVPFWGCYSTQLMQAVEDIPLRQPGDKDPQYALSSQKLETFKRKYKLPIDLVLEVIRSGSATFPKGALWDTLGISDDHGLQVKLGSVLKKLGCETKQGTGGGRYYVLPTQAEMTKRLADLGIDVDTLKEA